MIIVIKSVINCSIYIQELLLLKALFVKLKIHSKFIIIKFTMNCLYKPMCIFILELLNKNDTT